MSGETPLERGRKTYLGMVTIVHPVYLVGMVRPPMLNRFSFRRSLKKKCLIFCRRKIMSSFIFMFHNCIHHDLGHIHHTHHIEIHPPALCTPWRCCGS